MTELLTVDTQFSDNSGILLNEEDFNSGVTTLRVNHDTVEFEIDEVSVGKELPLVLVVTYQDRIRWQEPFNPDDPKKLCWSSLGQTPDPEGDQYGKVTSCADCQFSKWDNSNGKGKGIKPACDAQLNFVGVVCDPASEYFGTILQLRAKSTSYNAALRYLKPFLEASRIAKMTGKEPTLHLHHVCTKVSLTEGKYGKKSYGILNFSRAPLSEEVLSLLNIDEFKDAQSQQVLARKLAPAAPDDDGDRTTISAKAETISSTASSAVETIDI